jgi:hypothetical protein
VWLPRLPQLQRWNWVQELVWILRTLPTAALLAMAQLCQIYAR